MSRRNNKILETLSAYFAENGDYMDVQEYKAAEDVPIRYMALRRAYGSWSRVIQLVKQYEDSKPKTVEKPAVAPKKPIIKVGKGDK